MKVKIKNEQVSGIVAALGELIRLPVPVKTGMKIRNITRRIEQQHKDIAEEHLRLIELYAKRDAAGEKIREGAAYAVLPEIEPAFNELMGLEFECEGLLLAEIEGIREITTLTLLNLGDLLVEDLAPVAGG